MQTDKDHKRRLGDEPPILAGGTRAPDRREVSFRWLSSTFMTGITSMTLMGVALFVALEGKEQLAPPAVALASTDFSVPSSAELGQKKQRIRNSVTTNSEPDKLVMDVPTLVQDGDRQIVRSRPFAFVSMPLATNYNVATEYPKFNPLQIFANNENAIGSAVTSGAIYGAKIDSEISLRTLEFPLEDNRYGFAASMSIEEAEETVRTNGSVLIGQDSQIAALHFVDPRRFGDQPTSIFDFTAGINARVVAENVSIASYAPVESKKIDFHEDIQTVRSPSKLSAILTEAGYIEEQILIYEDLLSGEIDTDNLEPGMSLRIGVEQSEEDTQIMRLSVYEQNKHLVTGARNDRGRYVLAEEPVYSPSIAALLEDSPEIAPQPTKMPRVYDGIYQAGLSYGMTPDMIKQLIRMMAASVDFRARVKPSDRLEAFFSVSNNEDVASENSELLFISANFGGNLTKFYRFAHPEDGTVDYYNEDGRSARQFLIRNPVPTAKFRSAFGMRRHPITGRRRMHSGVDWSAPRGTPILAAGDGVVEKAGWHSGGYGKQTKIQHANGYVSSYSHQSKIAAGVVPGARVKQGQVIGYIGSTGLSTGPHLHYELIVNGTKVDPLRVRLPGGKTLKGEALDIFHRERRKLNALLDIDEAATELASN